MQHRTEINIKQLIFFFRVLKMVQTHYNPFYTYYLVFPKNHNKNYLKTHKTYLK